MGWEFAEGNISGSQGDLALLAELLAALNSCSRRAFAISLRHKTPPSEMVAALLPLSDVGAKDAEGMSAAGLAAREDRHEVAGMIRAFEEASELGASAGPAPKGCARRSI